MISLIYGNFNHVHIIKLDTDTGTLHQTRVHTVDTTHTVVELLGFTSTQTFSLIEQCLLIISEIAPVSTLHTIFL